MTTSQRWTLITVATGIIAFAIGAAWQYSNVHRLTGQLRAANEELTVQRLQNTLAAATTEALGGNHEQARLLTSNFFTMLQDSIHRAPASARPALDGILAQRDVVITSLSRAEPTAAQNLAQLFNRFRATTGQFIAPAPPAVPAAPAESGSASGSGSGSG